MLRKKLIELINNNIENAEFIGQTNNDLIFTIEKELSLTLPDDYKWFLLNYGSGGLYDEEILGYRNGNDITVIDETTKWRNFNLKSKYIVIKDCHEFLVCLNTEETTNGKSEVYFCHPLSISKNELKINEKFEEYLYNYFSDLIDNMKDN